MDNISNLEDFHKATNNELIAVRDKVRNLIGKQNWAEEGRYKESILRNMIRRFIPPTYKLGTGFVVKKINNRLERTPQIDILIIDTRFPVLFSDGDFYVVTPNSVRGVIEVKTRLKSPEVEEIVRKLNNDIGSFLINNHVYGKKPFVGLFSYESDIDLESIDKHVNKKIISGLDNKGLDSKCFINLINLNSDLLIKYSEEKEGFGVYCIKELAFSYFISNLIECVMPELMGSEYNTWFARNMEVYNKSFFK